MERTTKDKNIVMQGKIDLIRKQFGQRGERRSGAIRQAGWLCFFCAGGEETPAGAMGYQPARTKKEPEQKTFCSGGPPPCRYAARLLCRSSVFFSLTYLKLITDLS